MTATINCSTHHRAKSFSAELRHTLPLCGDMAVLGLCWKTNTRQSKTKARSYIGSKCREATNHQKALVQVASYLSTIPKAEHALCMYSNKPCSLFLTALSRCEFYCKKNNRDHFHDDSVGAATGSYDLAYIKAVLQEDEEEVLSIEQATHDLGYGPLVECTTVTNASSQRAFCRTFSSSPSSAAH
jgi:hypothetical protein